MGKISKSILRNFIGTNCLRQLFFNFAIEEKEIHGKKHQILTNYWSKNEESITLAKTLRKSSYLGELGKEYEQDVYQILKKIPHCVYTESSRPDSDNITKTFLNVSMFNTIYSNCISHPGKEIFILEGQFTPPETFVDEIISITQTPGQIKLITGDQRPDILLISNLTSQITSKSTINEILPNGEVKEIPNSQLSKRMAITVFDIKYILEDSIGKKQFIEILFYIRSLLSFLVKHNLMDKFFIRFDNNGILPQYNKDELKNFEAKLSLIGKGKFSEIVQEKIISIHYKEFSHVFDDITSNIREIYNKKPWDINDTFSFIFPRIQKDCAFCRYFPDCKEKLGMINDDPSENCSLRLLPNISPSSVEQLIKKGFRTIRDVHKNIHTIKPKLTPNALYPELALLKLKSKAIVEHQAITPKMGEIHNIYIPKYSPISLTFSIETDTANKRVFGMGIHLSIAIFEKTPYKLLFEQWWAIWSKYISIEETQGFELNEMQIKQLSGELTPILSFPVDIMIGLYLNCIRFLKELKIKKNAKGFFIEYTRSILNKGNTDDNEQNFTRKVIDVLYNVMTFSNILEIFIQVEKIGKDGNSFTIQPQMAVFYWGEEQVKNLQEMLERNFIFILNDKEIYKKFNKLINWFTPSESEITHPFKYKKLYNLKKFADTSIAVNLILTNTWHEIAKKTFSKPPKFFPNYWFHHFDFMDYRNWHSFIKKYKIDKKDGKIKGKKILNQIIFKTKILNSLRQKFQIEFSHVISKYKPMKAQKYNQSVYISDDYHQIARYWYLYSKLNGTISDLDAEFVRTTFPDYSIGKLKAAQVTDLQIIPDLAKKNAAYYRFTLKKLSSNMKIDKGNQIYLIPNELRGEYFGNWMRPYKITIESMFWDQSMPGYIVTTTSTSKNIFKLYEYYCDDNDIDSLSNKWFLYPFSFDSWTNKLYKDKKGLLETDNIGISWLANRLLFLWDITLTNPLKWEGNTDFYSNELYMFAPDILHKLVIKNRLIKPHSGKLNSPIYPSPNPSQKEAIIMALNNPISNILGPPGTGKTRTIAALIDEYLCQNMTSPNKKIRILVMAFSYAAIRVVVDAVRKSKDNKNLKVPSAQIQQVYIHSEYEKPIKNVSGLTQVMDIVKKSGNSWKINGKSRSLTKTKPLEDSLNDQCIIYTNAHNLFNLKRSERLSTDFTFDLIIVDEASQLPIDYILAPYEFINNFRVRLDIPLTGLINTKKEVEDIPIKKFLDDKTNNLTQVVIVGDVNQLPPVQPVKPPKNLKKVITSLFGYYYEHNVPKTQLETNYRSNNDIVGFTKTFGFYSNLHADISVRDIDLNQIGNLLKLNKKSSSLTFPKELLLQLPWIKEVLDPDKKVNCLIHSDEYEISVSPIESKIIKNIIVGYYYFIDPQDEVEELKFWSDQIGVVSPHNAHGRLIIRDLYEFLTINRISHLSNDSLMDVIKRTIVSVEKYQGSDREYIIASIGLSDLDQLSAEEEFIYDVNRYNVLTSRPKRKLTIVCSKKFLDYVPNTREIMEKSEIIRNYCYDYCKQEKSITFQYKKGKNRTITHRWK